MLAKSCSVYQHINGGRFNGAQEPMISRKSSGTVRLLLNRRIGKNQLGSSFGLPFRDHTRTNRDGLTGRQWCKAGSSRPRFLGGHRFGATRNIRDRRARSTYRLFRVRGDDRFHRTDHVNIQIGAHFRLRQPPCFLALGQRTGHQQETKLNRNWLGHLRQSFQIR